RRPDRLPEAAAAGGGGAAGGGAGQRQPAREQGREGGAAGAGGAGDLPVLPAGVQPGAERDRVCVQAGQAPRDPPAQPHQQGGAPRSGRTRLRPVSQQPPAERLPTTTAACLGSALAFLIFVTSAVSSRWRSFALPGVLCRDLSRTWSRKPPGSRSAPGS